MADGLNRWTGLGNLAADVELKVTQGGTSVLKFRLACNESYVDRNNERQERCEFVSCVLWGKRGEALSRFLTKGDRIFVEGSLRTTSWEQDGQKRYRTEVNVTNVILCGGGKKPGDPNSVYTPREEREDANRPRAKAPEPAYDDFGGGGDDEIPFAVAHDVAPRHVRRRGRWEHW